MSIVTPEWVGAVGTVLLAILAVFQGLALDLQVEPNMKGHLIEPGTYRLALLVAAENCPPREYQIELVISGDWHESEDEMLRLGFGMRVV